MSRLCSQNIRVAVWARSVRRLVGTAALCLALFAGLSAGTAGEVRISGAMKSHQANGEEPAKITGARPSRPKPKAKPKTKAKPKRSRSSSSGRKTSRRPTKDKETKRAPSDTNRDAKPAAPAGESEVKEVDIDAAYEQMLKPAEDRTYSISADGLPYGDLLDAFSRMSGLAILGDTPDGTVTYVSTEEMNYAAALSRMRKILFSHPENFYIWREGNSLEVFRITEAQRKMRPDRIYTNVGDFLAAGLDEMEVVLVLYTPKKSRVADLEPLRDFMPDYVRIAPFRDKNAVTILALARDVSKYLGYVEIFAGVEDDPRPYKLIPIRYVLPSYAVQMLNQFMPALTGGSPAKPPARKSKRRRPATSLASVKGHGIDLVPVDDRKKLFVRAMPDKIAEIEKYLAIIDVEYGRPEDPVIIPLEHTRVEQLIPLLRPFYTGQAASTSAKSKKKSRRKKPSSGGSIATDSLAIYPNPANNTLIVMADEEELTKLRMYISLFDIPTQEQTVRVPLEHAEADTIIQLVEQIVQSLDPIGAGGLIIKQDPAGGGFILVGNARAIELARGVIADLDQPSTLPDSSVHIYECRYAAPSALVGLLNTLDRESARKPTAPSGKKKGSRPPKKRSKGGTKYHGVDATRLLYVICTDTEWEEDYVPLLEMLDSSAELPRDITVILVENADPAEIIPQVTQALDPHGKGVAGGTPTLLPHPDGIMVLGARESDIEHLRRLVAEFDIDEGVERRTFTLRYANPSEVKTIVESLVVSRAGPRPKPKRGKKGKQTVSATSRGGPTVRIIQSGRNDLIVVAPRDEMTEIAELIVELDVDPLDMTVRVYEFAPGTDVREIAKTLSSFYPGSTSVPIGESKSKSKSRGKKSGRQQTKPGDIRFIPHVSARKILVSAPASLYEDIEEKIELLRPDGTPDGLALDFYPVSELDPETMVEILEPLLQTKQKELVAIGVLPEPVSVGKKGAAGKSFTMTADPRGDRIIFIGPAPLSAEAKLLIERLDRPDRERVFKTITLQKAKPAEMVVAIRGLLSHRPVAAKGKARKSSGKKKSASRRIQTGGNEAVAISEAPGGSAIVLNGYAEDVAEVEQWIHNLDEVSTDARELKIYMPKNIDVEKFADAVMTLVDSGGGKKTPKAKPKPKADSFFDDIFSFSTGGPRRGKDICLVTDTWAGTMLVSATPPKIREVDYLYAVYEGGPDGEEPLLPPAELDPIDTYTLVHREDAYDAVYGLEMILDALWTDPENKPKIDYIPFTNILTIRGRPDSFDKVKELIVEYVDKPGEGGTIATDRGFEVVPVKGIIASDMARLLQQRIGADKVHILGLPTNENGYGLEQVQPGVEEDQQTQPCVLPVSAVRWMSSAAWGLSNDEPEPEEVNSPKFSEKTKLKEDMLRSVAQTGGEDETKDVKPDASNAEPAATDAKSKPELTVVPDNERGVMVLEGTKQDVADLKYVIEKILDEMDDVPQPPDIRVFRVNYVDVQTASNIIEAMFNAPRQRMTAAQKKAMLQAARKQQKQQKEGEKDKNKRPGQPEAPAPAPQPTTGQIRIHPDARTRTLVIRAAPEQFPSIIKLLATIDKKGTAADFRIYKLERLNAAEVETTLKEMLGIGARQTTQRRRPQPRPGQRRTPQQVQQQLELAALEGESIKGQVTISSSPATNTIMAMAPEKTLELIGDLIKQLEEQNPPARVDRTYTLEHADPTEVVAKLEKLFGGSKSGSRGRSVRTKSTEGFDPLGVNQPIFIADERTNSITVRALELDLPKIEPAIERFDQKSSDIDKPQYIKLEHAKPSEIARKLQEAFGGGQRGSKGKSKSKVTITGDDGSMQLIVVASADVFADVQDMVSHIDVQQMNLEMNVYPLAHALAPEVLQQLTQLVRVLIQQGKGQGIDLGVFSAVADEKTNSLIVAGEPTIFPIVKGILDKIDIPPAAPVAVESHVYQLEFARASEVADTVNQSLRGSKRGQSAVTVVANGPLNQVIITGNGKDMEKVLPLIQQLDQPGASGGGVTVVEIENADAAAVAQSLTQTFGQRAKGGPQTVSITNPRGSNMLVIRANEKELEEIQTAIAQLEAAGTAGSGELKIIPLTYADAEETRLVLEEYLRKPGTHGGRGGGAPLVGDMRISVSAQNNSLILSGDAEQLEQIAEVVAQIDVQVEGGGVQIIKLHHAKASEIQPQLEELFGQQRRSGRGRGSSGGGMQPVIVANDTTNSLIVRAGPADAKEIERLVRQLDDEEFAGEDIRIVQVAPGINVEDMAVMLEESFNAALKGPGGRSGSGAGRQLIVTPDKRTNSLMLAGAPALFDRVEATIRKYEEMSPKGGQVTRIIRTKNIDVNEAEGVIRDLTEDNSKGSKRSSRGGRSRGGRR